jgi:hypothetical protein
VWPLRLVGIETVVRIDIGEGERQLALARPDAELEQLLDRDGAAHFVPVGERIDHHMRPRNAAVEGVHVRNPGIVLGIGTDIREVDLDRINLGGFFYQIHCISLILVDRHRFHSWPANSFSIG